jgi:ferredoxin
MPTLVLQDEGAWPLHAGETVLAGLRRHGVRLPASCEAGQCGTCKVELVAGAVEELGYDALALDEVQRSRGVVLACRCRVWGDVTLRRLPALAAQHVLGAVVTAVRPDGPAVELTVEVQAGDAALARMNPGGCRLESAGGQQRPVQGLHGTGNRLQLRLPAHDWAPLCVGDVVVLRVGAAAARGA